jgi:hypothetical protein
MKKYIYSLLIILIVVATAIFLNATRRSPAQDSPNPSPTPTSSGANVSNLIKVDKPTSGQFVSSPIEVTGQARGNWYFEASFPVKIYDGNGTELGIGPAQAEGEWMTENFVPFRIKLYFKKPATPNGTLVLQKDNPSGLPEYDAELRIPVKFDLDNWPVSQSDGCFIAGCSGQLCVDESGKDIITTCEFKEEYACYKTAKCERQENNQCGWTPTESLVACLSAAFQKDNPDNF